MTARKALDNLTMRAVLYRRKGKGTYVADSVMSYGLSTMLSFSQTLRAQGYTVETSVLLVDVIPASAKVQEYLQLGAESRAIIIRRLRKVEGKPAAIHTSFLAHRYFEAILEVDLSAESLLDAIQHISRMRIEYSRDSVQAALASPEDADLLDIEPGDPVLCVEGVAYTENGQPTRFTRGIYPGHLFKFVLTNRAEQEAALKVADLPRSD
jgi:GntR family transcriptional regulator